MAPLWPWLGAALAALPVALAGHGDPIAQKYIVEFANSKTVRLPILRHEVSVLNVCSHRLVSSQPLRTMASMPASTMTSPSICSTVAPSLC